MKPRISICFLLGWILWQGSVNPFVVVAAPQRWQPELVDELLVDEWPLVGGGSSGGDDRNILVAHDTVKRGIKHGFDQGPTIDSSSNNDILYNEKQSLSRLELEEEEDLKRLDQSILDILQHAIDTTEKNQPIRWISIEEATSRLLESHSRWTILYSYWTSLISSLVLWFCIMVIVAIIFLRKTLSKQLSSRDYHPHLLPSFTVCKQRRTVD